MTADSTQTTIRLTDRDQANIERIKKTGIATNTSEAIRVALAVAPEFLALWNSLLHARADNVLERLTKLQDELRRDREEAGYISVEELKKMSPTGELPKWMVHDLDLRGITVAPSTGRRR
ncbi:MAG TPA: hypothetical protein VGR87_03885 [Candidatus Limnocylindria bacterium]|jgi:hypothetical protein|nr:hypothetical protein [Candidatus Limnocylindria bacterium]